LFYYYYWFCWFLTTATFSCLLLHSRPLLLLLLSGTTTAATRAAQQCTAANGFTAVHQRDGRKGGRIGGDAAKVGHVATHEQPIESGTTTTTDTTDGEKGTTTTGGSQTGIKPVYNVDQVHSTVVVTAVLLGVVADTFLFFLFAFCLCFVFLLCLRFSNVARRKH